jgi:hypothetical protein
VEDSPTVTVLTDAANGPTASSAAASALASSQPPARRQSRREAWEDHPRPQVFVTDLACPPTAIPPPATVEVPAGCVLGELSDDELGSLLTAHRAACAAVYAERYAVGLPLHLPGDHAVVPDYPRLIENLGRAVREETLADEGLRFLAHGVYPVRDPSIDPNTPWRSQPWIPAQPGLPGRPRKPARRANIKGPSVDKGKGHSTHIRSEADAWKALADWYEEVEGIRVDVNPEPGSPMDELMGLALDAQQAVAEAREKGLPVRTAPRYVKGSGQRKKGKASSQSTPLAAQL